MTRVLEISAVTETPSTDKTQMEGKIVSCFNFTGIAVKKTANGDLYRGGGLF